MQCQPPQATLGQIVRLTRKRYGLSQSRLALRAGTSQDAISRIERGAESPSFERFSELLLVMGEAPLLETVPIASPTTGDQHLAASNLTPTERVRESASWNLVATKLEIAGAKARLANHPATRLNERE